MTLVLSATLPPRLLVVQQFSVLQAVRHLSEEPVLYWDSRDLVTSVWVGHREQDSSWGDEDLIWRGKGRDRVTSLSTSPGEDFLTSGDRDSQKLPCRFGISLVTTAHSSLSELPQGQSTWLQILTAHPPPAPPSVVPAEGPGQGRFVPTN